MLRQPTDTRRYQLSIKSMPTDTAVKNWHSRFLEIGVEGNDRERTYSKE